MPKLTFPGGALIGDAAGFVNVPKIKGIHNAMRSGMVAAEAVFELLGADGRGGRMRRPSYRARLDASPVMRELRAVRNIRPGFHSGLLPGLAPCRARHVPVSRARAVDAVATAGRTTRP